MEGATDLPVDSSDSGMVDWERRGDTSGTVEVPITCKAWEGQKKKVSKAKHTCSHSDDVIEKVAVLNVTCCSRSRLCRL